METLNSTELILVFSIVSVISGILSKKVWVIMKKGMLSMKFRVSTINGSMSNIETFFLTTLTKIYTLFGFISTLIVYFTITISLFLFINICLTLGIVSFIISGNGLPLLIYVCMIGIGILIEPLLKH